MSAIERRTIRLEHIAYWPITAMSGLFGLLAGLAVALPFLFLGGPERFGPDEWFELQSGILSYRMSGD